METEINPKTKIGAVHLKVADLEKMTTFYQDELGLPVIEKDEKKARLGFGDTLVELLGTPGARQVGGVTGLYHFAIRVPDRKALAQSIRHLVDVQANIQGASDHLVSEALYLADPEGNGIEVYRDRPRQEWELDAAGEVRMATLPMDLDGVMGELSAGANGWKGMPEGTRMGHVHLHVADVGQAEEFYHGAMGFNLMARYGTSAGFVSAGGYHHHIAFNTWAGVGAPPPPPQASGLAWFDVLLPDQRALEHEVERLQSEGVNVEESQQGFMLQDPSQNNILLRTS